MPWIGGAIAGGGALLGGLMGSGAASDAADAQAQAARDSNATQLSMFNQTRTDNAPWLQTGASGVNALAKLLGLGQRQTARDQLIAAQRQANPTVSENWMPDEGAVDAQIQKMGLPADDPMSSPLLRKFTTADLNADPVYNSGLQFGLDEGTKGINRQASATGSLLSGATLKALTKYGNDYGSTKAGEAQQRFTADQGNAFNKLAGISGVGQAAVGQVGAANQNYGNNVSATTQSLGNARGASGIAGANAWTGAINSGLGYYQGNQLLQTLQRGGTPTSAGSGYNGTALGGANYWETV